MYSCAQAWSLHTRTRRISKILDRISSAMLSLTRPPLASTIRRKGPQRRPPSGGSWMWRRRTNLLPPPRPMLSHSRDLPCSHPESIHAGQLIRSRVKFREWARNAAGILSKVWMDPNIPPSVGQLRKWHPLRQSKAITTHNTPSSIRNSDEFLPSSRFANERSRGGA